MKVTFFCLIIGSSCALGGEFDAKNITLEPQGVDSPHFQIGGGLMWRNIGKTNVNPRFTGGAAFFTPPAGVGTLATAADRTYDNGFVNIGAATPFSGLTTNFGYPTNPPQVGSDLIFSRAGGAAIALPTGGSDSEDAAIAPYLEFNYIIPVHEDVEIGLNLNFAFTGLEGSFASNVALSSVTTVDTYALNGVVVPNGSYSGPFGGAAPLIPNIPTSRQQNLVQTGTDQYRFQQDTNLYSLALGSDILWTPSGKFTFGIGAGLVLNIADWNAQSSNPAVNPATAAIFQNTVSNDDSDFLFGLYLEANASYSIDESWSIESFMRYDWTENLEASAGDTTFTVDLSGLSIGTGVTYRF